MKRVLGRDGEESEEDDVAGETGVDERTEEKSDSSTTGDMETSEGTRADELAADTLPPSTTDHSLDSNTMNVFDDPADSVLETNTETEHDSRHNPPPDLASADLTEKQLETLREIRDQPTATQADLADELGVTSATINQRLNSIDGFDWVERRAFTEALFNQREAISGSLGEEKTNIVNSAVESVADTTTTMPESNDSNSDGEKVNTDLDNQYCEELTDQVHELTEHVQAVERQLETQSTASDSILTDPELAHKVLHACFTSDQISKEEELRILESFTQ
ncbi:MarR family winged helix-turn-helix transcriptional regulator [Natronococcus occultus]|uniref:MarR family winged helix-turn-helix transcriptional regulator n=1 Tax=Natronococcus occultus TaxID=29288 RepID=UPI001C2741C9|nr:MarR family winged helix-turn-helix transcriptional regulator [Natronococcus occultus]